MPTYSVGVDLQAGQTYTLQLSGGGPSADLTWATPSELAPGIGQAVAAAKSASTAVVVVSDDTETEAADRPSLDLPSAQDELITAVAGPTRARRGRGRRRAGGHALAEPGGRRGRRLVPGREQRDRARRRAVRPDEPVRPPAGDLPDRPGPGARASPGQFPGVNGEVQYSEGIDVGYRWYDAHHETPMFPFGYGLSYTSFGYSD